MQPMTELEFLAQHMVSLKVKPVVVAPGVEGRQALGFNDYRLRYWSFRGGRIMEVTGASLPVVIGAAMRDERVELKRAEVKVA